MELDFNFCGFNRSEFFTNEYKQKIKDIHKKLHQNDHSIGTTWVDWPIKYDKNELILIQSLAKKIQDNSDVLLVVGIGGSYLGAKAGIDMLPKNNKLEIIFAGTNLDFSDLKRKLEKIKNKDVTVNVISKSGTTIEILVTLNIIEKFMKNKYNEDYKSRIIFTTDKNKGYLRERANTEGIQTLSVPDDMGGRYSVLSAVGLLPFAVAGINIKNILKGAGRAYKDLSECSIELNLAYQYAIYRHYVYTHINKKVEIYSSFSTKLASFGLWLQQLFCESEGKAGKGLFVSTLGYTTDLHSVGQYIQQGSQIVAETFMYVKNPNCDCIISKVQTDSPIYFLNGKTINDINNAAFYGTIKAHMDAKVPIVVLIFDKINEYNFGYLVYFFELACATSAYLLQVNPFDQPGVEQYKRYMKDCLK